MKIAIFSDIHANLPALEVVARHIEQQRYDAAYCLGDIGGYAGEPNETQALLQAMNCPTVLGNYDENVGFDNDECGCHYVKPFDIEMANISFLWTRKETTAKNKAWLRQLPREIRVEMDGRRILFCHGSPRSTTEYLFENRSDAFLQQFTAGGRDDANADVIVFGHTHVPYHRVVDNTHFINTGSVGRPKDGDPRTGYTVLTLEKGTLTHEHIRLEYPVEVTCQRLIAAGLPDYFARYLQAGGQV